MGERRVDSDYLNLRKAPKDGKIVAELPRATSVEVIGPTNVPGWSEVQVGTGNSMRKGVVSAKYLREPVSAAKEALMLAASLEWMRFNKGQGEEHKDPYFKYIGDMWEAINIHLTGKNRDQPWSAAFISWCVRNAGGYLGFKYHASHSHYAVDAIKKKIDGIEAPFWAWKIKDKKPELGDIVCQWRGKDETTYETAVQKGSYFSHCDIVVEVTSTSIRTLGGNVEFKKQMGETVGYKRYNLDDEGFLKPEKKLYAIMKNRK